MRYGRIFRLGRTRPAGARSSGSETLSRNQSLVGYTIGMRESDFSEGTRGKADASGKLPTRSKAAPPGRRPVNPSVQKMFTATGRDTIRAQ